MSEKVIKVEDITSSLVDFIFIKYRDMTEEEKIFAVYRLQGKNF